MEYINSVVAQRNIKDAEFANPQTTPLDSAERKSFAGIKYYQVDERYNVRATLTRFVNTPVFDLPHSNNFSKPYRSFGKVEFELLGKPCTLTVLEPANKKPGYDKYLLICFTDETSGNETYGSGRYIDIEIPQSNMLELDFNLAYNPYCAYSSRYKCPIPPRENHLAIAVRAGERYEKHN